MSSSTTTSSTSTSLGALTCDYSASDCCSVYTIFVGDDCVDGNAAYTLSKDVPADFMNECIQNEDGGSYYFEFASTPEHANFTETLYLSDDCSGSELVTVSGPPTCYPYAQIDPNGEDIPNPELYSAMFYSDCHPSVDAAAMDQVSAMVVFSLAGVWMMMGGSNWLN